MRRSRRAIPWAVLALVFACTPSTYRFHLDGAGGVYTYLVPDRPVLPAPWPTPVALPIEVVIDASLRAARWEHVIGADRFRFPLGEPLASHLPAVVRTVFPDATVVARPSGTRAVLRPRVVAIARTVPPNPPLGLSLLSLVLEWRLEEPDGTVVWIETITATGESGRDRRALLEPDQMHEVLRVAFEVSQRQLAEAAEVRAFAARAPSPQLSGAPGASRAR